MQTRIFESQDISGVVRMPSSPSLFHPNSNRLDLVIQFTQ